MDRVGNEEVHRRAGIERELASRADQRVLRWFGHVERMDENCMARTVLIAEVSGGRVLGEGKGKVFYGQEPPSGEFTTTECGFNYQLLAVMY